MNVTDGVWAIGDVTGVWPLTYVGKYQGRVAAANILGRRREANYEAVPRVVFTDPQAASVGAADGALTATAPISSVPRTSTYTRAYAEKNGFLTLVSDGERLTGAYALGPEAGEWLQQATVAIRAGVPLAVMNDVIQPFPSFSEIFLSRSPSSSRSSRPRSSYRASPRQNSRTASLKCSGCSRLLMCPAWGITTSRASGMPSRSCSATRSGERASCAPQISRVGTSTLGSRSRWSHAAIGAPPPAAGRPAAWRP